MQTSLFPLVTSSDLSVPPMSLAQTSLTVANLKQNEAQYLMQNQQTRELRETSLTVPLMSLARTVHVMLHIKEAAMFCGRWDT